MPSTNPRPEHGFAPADWRLLTRLPAEVMVATITARQDDSRRTVAEGLAGLDAIAAGRGSDSELVRAVVAAIYTEPADVPAAVPPAPVAPQERVRRALDDCRRAAEVLRKDADEVDAAAYREWLHQVAIRVNGAVRSGGVLGVAAGRVDPGGGEFLHDLSVALS
jgi:hypothetical protein